MESIGTQVKLPLNIAMQIAMQGIRIRLGRALVTISGVVLGIAFFMSVLTGELIIGSGQYIKGAVYQEQELRQTVKLMGSIVQAEVGDVKGKTLAVAAFGTPTQADLRLIHELQKQKPAVIRVHGMQAPGTQAVGLNTLTDDAFLLLIMGDNANPGVSLTELIAKMSNNAVIDTLPERQLIGKTAEKPSQFFSAQTEAEKARLVKKAKQATFRTLWIVSISLLVTIVGIANALLMSVTERFKEIGTMKCLGALSSFIRRLFLIESIFIGLVGSVLGVVIGALIPMLIYGFTFGFGLVFGGLNYGLLLLAALAGVVVGTLLSMVAAIYPANFAARMVPANALRSNV